jgi:iron(III) transport system ATP-binding protein
MNQGRIEQVDVPHALYNRPKTRFVAGFIGRTNFIDGTAGAAAVDFGVFSVPRAALEGAPASGAATFSVRPQSMTLSRAAGANGAPHVAVTIAERAYLGEFWDYVVAPPGGALKLRVTASPLDIYQVGESAFLTFDPKQMTPIS